MGSAGAGGCPAGSQQLQLEPRGGGRKPPRAGRARRAGLLASQGSGSAPRPRLARRRRARRSTFDRHPMALNWVAHRRGFLEPGLGGAAWRSRADWKTSWPAEIEGEGILPGRRLLAQPAVSPACSPSRSRLSLLSEASASAATPSSLPEHAQRQGAALRCGCWLPARRTPPGLSRRPRRAQVVSR